MKTEEHDWQKTDMVSGVNTNYRCTKCGAKGVRHGVSWPPRSKSNCKPTTQMKTKIKEEKKPAAAPAAAKKRNHPEMVPIAMVRPDPNQPRKDFPEESLREMADSL